MTPEQTAAEMVADPAWSFQANPTKAISYATGSAAAAYNGIPPSGVVDHDRAKFWTAVGLELVRLADSPYETVGAVLGGLADAYGLR